MNERFQQQLNFLVEIDKMKTVLRQTILIDQSRQENDAEHSWHFAVTAMILSEYAAPEVDISRVVKIALIHDLIEIYAGDTFAYDEEGYEDKTERELAAADKIFGMLPPNQRAELYALWQEFEQMETPDAKYAAAMDRIQPLINGYMTDDHTWRLGGVTIDKVYRRMAPVKTATPELWPFVEHVIASAIEKGHLTA